MNTFEADGLPQNELMLSLSMRQEMTDAHVAQIPLRFDIIPGKEENETIILGAKKKSPESRFSTVHNSHVRLDAFDGPMMITPIDDSGNPLPVDIASRQPTTCFREGKYESAEPFLSVDRNVLLALGVSKDGKGIYYFVSPNIKTQERNAGGQRFKTFKIHGGDGFYVPSELVDQVETALRNNDTNLLLKIKNLVINAAAITEST